MRLRTRLVSGAFSASQDNPHRRSRTQPPLNCARRALVPLRRAGAHTRDDILTLQKSAGNAAVTRLLRQAAPEAPASTRPLRAARFADMDRLQKAAQNKPPLQFNEVHDAIARVQRAFLDLGYKMPKTTKKGFPDGHYGQETADAVRRFQTEFGVKPPGGHEAGKKTLTRLDEVFLKRDAPIDPPTPMITGVGVRSTTPAVETPDKKVTTPDAQVTPTPVEPAPEATKEHPLQIEVGGGLEADAHLKKPPEQPEPPDFFCDHAKLQVGIKGNINLFKLGNTVTLLPNIGLGFNVVPAACGKGPGIEAHIDLLKLKLSEAIELGVMTSFEPKDIGLKTGWIGRGGIAFEAKPFKKIPLKVEAEFGPGIERFQVGSSGIFIWLVSGSIGLKYEFGFF